MKGFGIRRMVSLFLVNCNMRENKLFLHFSVCLLF